MFSWPNRYVNKCEKNSPENLNGQYWENSWQFGMYTEPKRAHYEEQFEHNEKVGRRICRCHLPIWKIIGDDFGENGKNQPRLLFESSVPRGKTPEDTYFLYLHFVWLLAWVTVAKKKPQLATCSVATMLRKTILMITRSLGLQSDEQSEVLKYRPKTCHWL